MTRTRKAFGDSIKALEGNRVSGYLVRFTSKDDPDLHGEYFTKDTNFWVKELSPVGKPVFLDHTFDGKFKSIPVGIIDFLKEDEIGLWIEAKLKERAEYEDMLRGWKNRKWISDEQLKEADIPILAENIELAVKTFFGTGKAQWSSGALPQVVEIAEDGHIESWPIIEGTGVFTPAEPEGTEIKLKSALEQMSNILKSVPAPAREDAYPIEQIADNLSNTSRKSQKQGMKDMELWNQLLAVIAQLGAALGYTGEGEAESMATAVVDELKADPETPTEEEMAKMADEDIVKASDKLAEKAVAKLHNLIDKKKTQSNAVAKAFDNHIKAAERAAKPVDNFGGGGARSEFSGRSSRVSVGENLKYAHLSASDMALGIVMKMAPAKSQGINVNLRDAFSEDYLRTFANKAVKFSDSDPYTKGRMAGKSFGHWQQAQSADTALKSLIPFKANELNASDIAGQGTEWVSEWWSTDLWERERFERHYDALVSRGMMVQTIPQGADTAHFPTEGSDPVAYVAPQANSVGADGRPETTANFSPYATGEVTCTPLEIKIATSQTVILEEDSIINVVQNVNRQLNEAALETRDKLLVNGDDSLSTSNINYDGAQVPLGLQRPYYTASDGFRLHGLTNNAVDANNTLALNTYRLTLAELDAELRQYYERMLFFIDPTTEMASLAIPEIATDDVRRSFATVTSGRILNVFGIDVRVNGFIPQTDTDGKVTASGNVANRGTILLVYAPYWGFAYKRQITLETARNIWSGTNDYVMSMRIGMVARGTNATALTYNVATAVS